SHGCVIRLKEGASVVTVDLKAVGTGVAEFVARQVATTVLVEKQDQFACQPIRFFRLPRRDAVGFKLGDDLVKNFGCGTELVGQGYRRRSDDAGKLDRRSSIGGQFQPAAVLA